MRFCFYILSKAKFITWLLIVLCISANTFAQKKPNIILILADDVGYYNLTVNGGQSYSTPNLDSMARNGINFTHCETAPLCCASRSMLLTGKYLNRNYSNWGYMNADAKTIANVMKDAGYTTEIFGKLQFEYSVQQMQSWGWDKHIVFELTEDTMAYRRYKNPVLRENGHRIPDSVTAGKYCDDILTDRILDFIDSNKTKPFFAYYSMSIGHDPFCPTPDDPEFAAWDPKSPSNPRFYPSMMNYMDKKVGVILDKLRSAGIANNTLIIYAGDNGTPSQIFYSANGVNHIQGEKGKTTEGGTHVPLIVYWPGHVQLGSTNDDLIDLTDFLPTLAQAGDVKNLSAYGQLDGVSFYPQILGRKGTPKKQLYCFYDPENQNNDSLRIWERNKIYKLYDSTGVAKDGMFFNTVNDPEEVKPLADNKLTVKQKNIKDNFQLILDSSYSWPDCPGITNPFSNQITSSSATIGATITSQGASALIEKGTCLSTTQDIFLSSNRLKDTSVKLGTFSVKRTGLKAQTAYNYIVYAMNANVSHSTGSVQGVFQTLSKSTIKQPSKFTVNSLGDSISIEWNDAVFPKTGATKAGYVIVYSTGEPLLIDDANGKAPEKIAVNGKLIIVPSVGLPSLPAKKIKLSELLSDSNYNFILIPYTWNGTSTSTCNYLIKSALKTKLIRQIIALNNDLFKQDTIAENVGSF